MLDIVAFLLYNTFVAKPKTVGDLSGRKFYAYRGER